MGIVIAGGDEDRNGINPFQLLLQKLDRIRCRTVMLEKVPSNQNKRHLLSKRAVQDTPEGASNGLALAVSKPRWESGSRKAGIQVQIGSMYESDRGH